MAGKKHRNLLGTPPAVVGTIHTPAGIDAALRLKPGAVDFLEVRIDALLNHHARLLRSIPRLQAPLILTVRDPREGGHGKLPITQRIDLFERFIDSFAAIDIELKSLRKSGFKKLAQRARLQNQLVACSFHDFKKTPTPKQLHLLAVEAKEAGADIFKVAAHADTPEQLGRLLCFLAQEDELPLAVMAMGKMGKISRLLLAHCGSVLNYGFLDKAQVSGQWPAVLLKQRLRELSQQ